MATRKSEDDARDAGERPAEERPGSYVQVVGTPRRRKSSKGHVPVVPPGDDEASGQIDRVGAAAARYQVDPTSGQPRVERTFGAPAKAPAGAGPERKPRPRNESLTKTAVGMGGIGAELARALAEQRTQTPEEGVPVRPPLESQTVRVDRVHTISSEPPAPRAPIAVVEEPPLASHAIVPAASAPSQRPSVPREELPSVFEARPSIRPSDPVPTRGGPSWSMLVGVAMLSSIIAAAGVVALQELLRSRGERPVAESFEPRPAAPAPGEERSVRAARAADSPVVTAPTEARSAKATPAPEPLVAPPAPPSEPAVGSQATAPVVEVATPPSTLPPSRPRPAVASPGRPTPARVAPSPAGALAPAPVATSLAAPSAPQPGAGKNRVLSGEFVAPDAPPESARGDDTLPSNPYAE